MSVLRGHHGAETIVRHVPRQISSLAYFFLMKNGTILCQVTGRRRSSVDLPQRGLEVPCTLTFIGKSEYIKVRKLATTAPHINLELEPPSKKQNEVIADKDTDDLDQLWLTFQGCILTEYEKLAITSNNRLTDWHINYAQALLRQQYPPVSGFKNTILQARPPKKKISSGGLQIIHDRGNHCICSLAIGSEDKVEVVQVYDSIFSCVDDDTVKVINNLFNLNTNTEIKIMKMQQQTAQWTVCNCCVYFIAAQYMDVSSLYFSQNEIRQHLLSYFTDKPPFH